MRDRDAWGHGLGPARAMRTGLVPQMNVLFFFVGTPKWGLSARRPFGSQARRSAPAIPVSKRPDDPDVLDGRPARGSGFSLRRWRCCFSLRSWLLFDRESHPRGPRNPAF